MNFTEHKSVQDSQDFHYLHTIFVGIFLFCFLCPGHVQEVYKL